MPEIWTGTIFERDQRELSLLMALRVCQFYKLIFLQLADFFAVIRSLILTTLPANIIKYPILF
jgi:hypothetical protein